jgi:hypothetical protein
MGKAKKTNMDYEHEFGTVELLLNSKFETKGVDAFTISLLKSERQIRKIFTFLIFQNERFSRADVLKLKEILSLNSDMYFENFIRGIDDIYLKRVEDIYGNDYTEDFKELIKISKEDRNKIFHGQLTNKCLTRPEILTKIEKIKKWSKRIAENFDEEVGYDGFGRNSYRKSERRIELRDPGRFSTITDYEIFLKTIDRSKKKPAHNAYTKLA